jgi:hypothetical protein
MAKRPKGERGTSDPEASRGARRLASVKLMAKDASRLWRDYLASPEAERPDPLPGQGELFDDAGESG